MAEIDDQRQQRLAKLARLREAGVEPYPVRFARTHTCAQAVEQFEQLAGQEVRLAGRIVGLRPIGRITFAVIADETGRIQLWLRSDLLGAERYAIFRNFDLGDFIGASGRLVLTRTGERTLEAHDYQMLSKALRPLPEKWHGLTDVETRYRQRYLDLIANAEVRDTFLKRTRLVTAIREFLDARGFMEVETPILQPLYGGATATPFETVHRALGRRLYLRIADELYLKRLIIGGLGKVYEICKDFRNEGISTKHNPEFTMLELYEAFADYRDVMRLVEEMFLHVAERVVGGPRLTYQGDAIDLTPPWRRLTLRDAILEYSGIDVDAYPEREALAEVLQARGVRYDEGASRGKLIDELLSTYAEPRLIQPTFLIDYPLELSPLAKKRPDNPAVVERFEAFVGGLEVGNAYSELNDPLDQRERFLDQQRQRAGGDLEAQPLDEDFLLAMEYGMPPTGGLGVGIDRLTMLFTDHASIREVILFPQLRS